MNLSHLMSQHQNSNPNNNIFQYFLFFFLQKTIFLISTNQTCFLFQKYKKIFFSLYFQKQVSENKKQKLLSNITIVCGTHEQCTGALFMGEKSKSYGWKKKKTKTQTCIQEAQNTLPKRTLSTTFLFSYVSLYRGSSFSPFIE